MNNNHIHIQIKDRSTTVSYVQEGDKLHTHVYDYGYIQGASKGEFLAGILYMLEMINMIDHIPERYILDLDGVIDVNPMRHKLNWYTDTLQNYNYTQFVRGTNRQPYVIINTNERYKKGNHLGLKL